MDFLKQFKLVPNAKAIATRSHSMWANYAGIVALLSPYILYETLGIETDPQPWFWVGLALLVYGVLGRLIGQSIEHEGGKLWSNVLALVATAAVVLILAGCERKPETKTEGVLSGAADFDEIAVAHVGKWEGLRLDAYLDPVGVPTVCYGETKGVAMGMSHTKDECDAMLLREVRDYRDRLRPAFTPDTVAERLPVLRDVAYTSLAYNAGVSAIKKSTAVKRLNAGDVAGGCEAIGWWNRAGGKVWRGLVLRRADEVAMCKEGLT